jgi:uncharacterized coiled-coil DUF342 family protein
MRTPRKSAAVRKARVPIREEVVDLRRQVDRLHKGMNELKGSTADLRRGHDMSLRRFGEIQLEIDALKKTTER